MQFLKQTPQNCYIYPSLVTLSPISLLLQLLLWNPITMNGLRSSNNNNPMERNPQQPTQTDQVVNWVITCPHCSRSFITSPLALGDHQNAPTTGTRVLQQGSRGPFPYPYSTSSPSTMMQVRHPPPIQPGQWFGYRAPMVRTMQGNGFIPNLMYGSGPAYGALRPPTQPSITFNYFPFSRPSSPAVVAPTSGPAPDRSTGTDPTIGALIQNDNDFEMDSLNLSLGHQG